MKAQVLNSSPCQRNHVRVWCLRLLVLVVLISCSSLASLNRISLAADEESQKAIRRSSSETGASQIPSSEASSLEYRTKAESLAALYGIQYDASTKEELHQMFKNPEAVKWFRLEADQGDALAQWCLGRMFDFGLEVPKDYKEALKWYKKSAEQGNALGQSNLGVMYRDGLGVSKDYKEAVKWFNTTVQSNKEFSDRGNSLET